MTGGGGEHSLKISALTVWVYRCFEGFEEKDEQIT